MNERARSSQWIIAIFATDLIKHYRISMNQLKRLIRTDYLLEYEDYIELRKYKLESQKLRPINAKRLNEQYILSMSGYLKILVTINDLTAQKLLYKYIESTFSDNVFELNQLDLECSSELAKKIAHKLLNLINDDNNQLPSMTHKEYNAQEVGKVLGLTANKVGRIANRLGLKAEQPGQNEYGRWAISKSKYSSREVHQWLYYETAIAKIESQLENRKIRVQQESLF